MASSRHPQMPDNKPCYLGALPPELVDNIFLAIDTVRTLGNFMTTARFVYRRFEERKERSIFRVLQNELGPVLTDAKFLRIFPYADPDGPGGLVAYWDGIHTMAAVYRDMLGGRGDGAHAVPGFTELTELCRTLHNMNFLASTYLAVQQRSFGDEGAATAPLSQTERLRVLRAFYRRQIVCNAWAPTRREPRWTDQDTAAIGNTSDHKGVRLGLFAAFEPWELQQVDHADHFVTRLCAALRIAGEEAAPTPPSADPPAPVVVAQPIGEAEFGEIFSHVDRLARYMREHPGIANAALRALPSLPRLGSREVIDTAPAWAQLALRYSLLCLRYGWQSFRLHSFPDPARDQREQQQQQQQEEEVEAKGRATLEFVGDAEDLPPFGWVDALDGRNLNWYGNALYTILGARMIDKETCLAHYDSLELWRGAGFALWDRSRVEALKELDRLRMLRTGWVVY